MKKFFIFKNGQIIGSQIGYTTYKGALKSLIGTNDWMSNYYHMKTIMLKQKYQKN